MTPADNIYHSDYDDVDGIVDVEQFAEDFTNDSIDTLRGMTEDDQYDIYDDEDDGQPDLQQECDDLYGYGQELPEDWSL